MNGDAAAAELVEDIQDEDVDEGVGEEVEEEEDVEEAGELMSPPDNMSSSSDVILMFICNVS